MVSIRVTCRFWKVIERIRVNLSVTREVQCCSYILCPKMCSATVKSIFSVTILMFAVIGQLAALKCATDGKTMSKCALSDGANGTLDLAPIFASGPLNVTSTMNPTK